MTLQALSRETHQNLRLRTPPEQWSFARGRMIAGLVAPELPEVVKSMPMAFTLQGEQANLVALMGLGQQNLFVGPSGQWLGPYIPAVLRAWPFALMKQGEQRVVAINADNDAVGTEEGELLFSENGEPGERLQRTVQFLQSFSDQEIVMGRAVEAIRKAGLLVPWELTVNPREGASVNLTGLYQIDRAAFEALDDDGFLSLRRAGALPVVYAHVFSQRNVSVLEQLARRIPAAAAPEQPEQSLPSMPEFTDDYLRF
jgi:hypothetical protein